MERIFKDGSEHPFRLNYFYFFDRYWILFQKYYSKGKAKCAAELVNAIGGYVFEGKEPQTFSSQEVECDWQLTVLPALKRSTFESLRKQKQRTKGGTVPGTDSGTVPGTDMQ